MKIFFGKSIILLFLLLFQGHAINAEPLKVVTSFSILKNFVEEIGKEYVVVDSIVGPNSDTHVYEPSPQDAKKLSRADIVFINGLGFEGWMKRLIEASGYKGEIVETAQKIPVTCETDHNRCNNHSIDPHAWHSLKNAVQYVKVITEALSKGDPKHAAQYKNNAQQYIKKIEALNNDLKKKFSQTPLKKRVIVTTHKGFRYFGKEYDITFLSPMGLSTEAEPAPKTIAHIIDEIKKNNIKTIFLENITSPKLIEQLAHETGAKVGSVVYSDALSDQEGPAPTYLDMISYNANLFLQALEEKLPH